MKYQDNTTQMLYASRQLDLSQEKMIGIVQSTQKVEEAGGFPLYFEVFSRPNFFIYQARESSLVSAGFVTAQFLQKL